MKHGLNAQRRRAGQRTQSGFSLVELSIALAIVSVVIVGSLIGVQRILANNRANNLLTTVPKVNAAIVGVSANGTDLKELTTDLAIRLGVFPESSVVRQGDIASARHAFGGNLFVRGLSTEVGGVPAGAGYLMTLDRVPKDMCATVVNGIATLATGIWVTGEAGEDAKEPLKTAPLQQDVIKDPATNNPIKVDEVLQKCISDSPNGTKAIHALMTF